MKLHLISEGLCQIRSRWQQRPVFPHESHAGVSYVRMLYLFFGFQHLRSIDWLTHMHHEYRFGRRRFAIISEASKCVMKITVRSTHHRAIALKNDATTARAFWKRLCDARQEVFAFVPISCPPRTIVHVKFKDGARRNRRTLFLLPFVRYSGQNVNLRFLRSLFHDEGFIERARVRDG